MPLFKKARPATGDYKAPAPAYEPSKLAKTIVAHMQLHPEKWVGTEVGDLRYDDIWIYRRHGWTNIYKGDVIVEHGGRKLFEFLCDGFGPVRAYQLEQTRKRTEEATEAAIEILS